MNLSFLKKDKKRTMLSTVGIVFFVLLIAGVLFMQSSVSKNKIKTKKPFYNENELKMVSEAEETEQGKSAVSQEARQVKVDMPADMAQGDSSLSSQDNSISETETDETVPTSPASDEEIDPTKPVSYKAPSADGSIVLIDDFDSETEILNKLSNKANVYVKAPSRIMISYVPYERDGKITTVLMIKYDKANEGGPYGIGGWCGYYSLLKNEKEGLFLDASDYNYITFWVRGEKGDENFVIGLADKHWEKVGDSLKSEEIVSYIEGGKIPVDSWVKVRIPLSIFFLDRTKLQALTINFEGDCFSEGKGAGTIYVDDIALEK